MCCENTSAATPSLPRLGSPAPSFEAVTTHGTLRLEDFKGSWLILFSHPADFTPVCTTEFIAFAEIHADLRRRNVELLGLSIDSVYSHIAWVRNIEEKMGVKVNFPVIADLNKEVATAYGIGIHKYFVSRQRNHGAAGHGVMGNKNCYLGRVLADSVSYLVRCQHQTARGVQD